VLNAVSRSVRRKPSQAVGCRCELPLELWMRGAKTGGKNVACLLCSSSASSSCPAAVLMYVNTYCTQCLPG
jgi:hypothetical protein